MIEHKPLPVIWRRVGKGKPWHAFTNDSKAWNAVCGVGGSVSEAIADAPKEEPECLSCRAWAWAHRVTFTTMEGKPS